MTKSPADLRSQERVAYVQELGLEWHSGGHSSGNDYYVYNWPAAANGSSWDRFVVIEEFSDGSCGIYLNASEPSFKAKCVQLREMANP